MAKRKAQEMDSDIAVLPEKPPEIDWAGFMEAMDPWRPVLECQAKERAAWFKAKAALEQEQRLELGKNPDFDKVWDGTMEVSLYGLDRGTEERGQHDEVAVESTYEMEGRKKKLGTTVRVQDVLKRLMSDKRIDEDELKAGQTFQNHFDKANYDPLKSPDLARIPGQAGGGVSDKTLDARERVWGALIAVGGHTSIGGSSIWHILGSRLSVEEWSRHYSVASKKPMYPAFARGVLVASLGVLSKHYGYAPWSDR